MRSDLIWIVTGKVLLKKCHETDLKHEITYEKKCYSNIMKMASLGCSKFSRVLL